MSNTRVANRYAKSLISLAIEKKDLDLVFNDMELIVNTCSENRDLVALLKSPIVHADKKESILVSIFGEKIGNITNQLIKVIVRKKRESLLPEIAKAFVNFYKVEKNITVAKVISAIPLTKELRDRISDVVKKMKGSEVELEEIVDRGIIGGYILKVDDKQVDASMIRRIADLKKEFSRNLYVSEL